MNRKKKKKNVLSLTSFFPMQSFQLVNRITVNERKTMERKKNRFNREKKSKEELRRMDETVIFTVQWYTQNCPREHILKVNWKRTNELRHGAAAA